MPAARGAATLMEKELPMDVMDATSGETLTDTYCPEARAARMELLGAGWRRAATSLEIWYPPPRDGFVEGRGLTLDAARAQLRQGLGHGLGQGQAKRPLAASARGFTLIELIVTVAIICTLGALAIWGFKALLEYLA